jgi:hypothetical protein
MKVICPVEIDTCAFRAEVESTRVSPESEILYLIPFKGNATTQRLLSEEGFVPGEAMT